MSREGYVIEKIGHIKNPLSVIAIFAAIAEISGTTVLPFIESNNQIVYIWFLMFFPIFLVGAFFLTLNFNHRVLYAPSDYRDEKHFVSHFVKARPEEQSKKLNEEVMEVEADETEQKPVNPSIRSEKPINTGIVEIVRDRKLEIMAEVVLAEKLAINKLSKDTGLDFKTGIKFELALSELESKASSAKIKAKMGIIYDAVHISDEAVQSVEVKLFKTNRIEYSRLMSIVKISERVASQCGEVSSKHFTLHIFAVIAAPNVDIESVKNKLKNLASSSEINVVVHVARLDDLQNEYQYST